MSTLRTRAGVIPRLATGGLIALALPACRADAAESLPEFTLGERVEVIGPQRAVPAGVELFNATGLSAADSGLLIMDSGNRRVLRLDSHLRVVGSIGGPGAGPGELGFAPAMSVRGDTVAIADLTNARVMLVDWRRGTEVRTRPAWGIARGLAWLDDGSFLMPSSSAEHYLSRADADGGTSAFAERPAILAAQQVAGAALFAGCGDGVHVLDDDHGVLLRYSLAGELLHAHRLPSRIRRSLLRQRARTVRTFQRQGYRVQGLPLVKQLAPLSCDAVLILFSDDRLFGVLVDYATAAAHPLVLPDRQDWRQPLRTATAVLPGRTHLVVLSQDEVYSYAYK